MFSIWKSLWRRWRKTPPTRRLLFRPACECLEDRVVLSADPLTAPDPARIAETYGKLPLSFEANRGQSDSQVNYLARGSGYALFLSPTQAVVNLTKPSATESSVLRMELLGANTAAAAKGVNELAGKVNYLVGDDPAAWHADVPTFGRVEFDDVYQGIDIVYYGNQRQLEYDFMVAPGADPAAIALKFGGADRLEVDARGDLVLHADHYEVRLNKPMLYQLTDGVRQEVAGSFVLDGDQVTFSVGAYDTTRELVIDPILVYSTYLAGSGTDVAYDIAVDSQGFAYVVGITNSTNFLTANALQPGNGGGEYDVFVTKLNPTGTALVYSTYLGGNGRDDGYGIAVDSQGFAYVTGGTGSTNFPTVGALQGNLQGSSDVFVAKLNSSGSALTYSTYLGGSRGETGYGIAVDSLGFAYVTGNTSSTNFPMANPRQAAYGGGSTDAFVARINPAGNTLAYSTYLGGSDFDLGYGIAVDSQGFAHVAGTTGSANFPTVNPRQAALGGNWDAFVAKYNPNGASVYATYLGGSGIDLGFDIDVDPLGFAYATGSTNSTNFPTANPLQAVNAGGEDVFVTKFSPSGSTLAYSTYLGGSGGESAWGIAVDSQGFAHLVGSTTSANFPTASPIQGTNSGSLDAFVTKVNPAGTALAYSTFLGGSASENGMGIAVDSLGFAYVAGATSSTNFPTANPIQGHRLNSLNGVWTTDAFVAKISPALASTATGSLLPQVPKSAGTLPAAPAGTVKIIQPRTISRGSQVFYLGVYSPEGKLIQRKRLPFQRPKYRALRATLLPTGEVLVTAQKDRKTYSKIVTL